MFNHELYAATLARAVDVMRQQDAVEQQKASLRAMVSLAAASSATVRCYDGVLSIDDVGIPDTVPHVGTLMGRMAAHGVAEIAIGRDAGPAELLALLRGLAATVDSGPALKDRLRDVHAERIWVLVTGGAEPPARGSVSHLFAEPADTPRPAYRAPTRREDEDALAAWDELHSEGGGGSAIREFDLGIVVPPPEPELTPPPAPAVSAPEPDPVPDLPIPADTPLGRALLAVVRQPYDGDILDRLTAFSERVAIALRQDEADAALSALGVVARLEPGAPDGTPRNSYRIVLRRILDRETLVQIAAFTTDPALADPACEVLACASAEGTEVLLGLLASAESMRERKAYVNALKVMPEGRDQIVLMLTHPQWFVVRNVAELAGEMRLEEAVPTLGGLLTHADARVRRAAALALVKFGTPPATDALLRALREGNAETRTLIASLVGQAQGDVFTMPLAALLESEEDLDALREVCLALGRLGSPSALEALERAQAKGGMFSKRARALKDAAAQALQRTREG